MKFRVDQIDHAELTVPDRQDAAAWYQNVLGLEILPEFEFWSQDPLGPLMIGTATADTKLALFTGSPTGSRRNVGYHLVAFRVSGAQFLNFLAGLETLQLMDRKKKTVKRDNVVDHVRAFSLYFCDPWGHELELTTYECDVIREAIEDRQA